MGNDVSAILRHFDIPDNNTDVHQSFSVEPGGISCLSCKVSLDKSTLKPHDSSFTNYASALLQLKCRPADIK